MKAASDPCIIKSGMAPEHKGVVEGALMLQCTPHRAPVSVVNLFQRLYSYRPRQDLTPHENYLTEAFAAVLEIDRFAREQVLFLVANSTGISWDEVEVATQVRYDCPGRDGVIADMVIRAVDPRQPLTILFEHKWGSRMDLDQLKRYRTVYPSPQSIVFISANLADVTSAKFAGFKAFIWADVHLVLSNIAEPSSFLESFLEYMSVNGLSYGAPISAASMEAFLQRNVVPDACHRIANQLNSNDWNSVPREMRKLERRSIQSLRWGRIGLNFGTDRKPLLFVGFLLDGGDHKLPLLLPDKSIDLMLSLDADERINYRDYPQFGKKIQQIGTDIRNGGMADSVLGPDELRNKWRKLVIRHPLASVIQDADSDSAQCESVYQRLQKWCECLFSGGEVEAILREIHDE